MNTQTELLFSIGSVSLAQIFSHRFLSVHQVFSRSVYYCCLGVCDVFVVFFVVALCLQACAMTLYICVVKG